MLAPADAGRVPALRNLRGCRRRREPRPTLLQTHGRQHGLVVESRATVGQLQRPERVDVGEILQRVDRVRLEGREPVRGGEQHLLLHGEDRAERVGDTGVLPLVGGADDKGRVAIPNRNLPVVVGASAERQPVRGDLLDIAPRHGRATVRRRHQGRRAPEIRDEALLEVVLSEPRVIGERCAVDEVLEP